MPESKPTWTQSAREQMLALRCPTGGWGYRAASTACVEPTVLGCLSLAASDGATVSEATKARLEEDSRWIGHLQQADGAIGVSADLPRPQWPTALAVLLWIRVGDQEQAVGRSLQWLMRREGNSFSKPPGSVLGHDTSISGWPWVAGTHPWLEPTAMAMLALSLGGYARHTRVASGVHLVLDRAIAGGGWNVGNSAVFGRPLRPHPAPTGLALLALRAAGQEESRAVTKACSYLERALPVTRSPESLCWGILGWTAWRTRMEGSDQWLAQSFHSSPTLNTSPTRLAYLLLAAHATAADLFADATARQTRGVAPTERSAEMVLKEAAGI